MKSNQISVLAIFGMRHKKMEGNRMPRISAAAIRFAKER